MIEVHGKRVVIIGNRCFAVRKDVGLAERIAMQSQGRSNYQRAVSNIPNPRLRNTRSIKA
jgi:hypothetical protein